MKNTFFVLAQVAVHYLVRSDFVVDLLNAHFSGSYITTLHKWKQR